MNIRIQHVFAAIIPGVVTIWAIASIGEPLTVPPPGATFRQEHALIAILFTFAPALVGFIAGASSRD